MTVPERTLRQVIDSILANLVMARTASRADFNRDGATEYQIVYANAQCSAYQEAITLIETETKDMQ